MPYKNPEDRNRWARINHQKNKEHKNKKLRETRIKDLEIVFEHYSNGIIQCCCCYEKIRRFLQLGHIYDNGGHHRKKITKKMATWLIQNDFPPIIEIVCANCNFGKRMNGGICPHKEILLK